MSLKYENMKWIKFRKYGNLMYDYYKIVANIKFVYEVKHSETQYYSDKNYIKLKKLSKVLSWET